MYKNTYGSYDSYESGYPKVLILTEEHLWLPYIGMLLLWEVGV